MLTLGIESSCDETAAAVVEGPRRVRSSVVASQVQIHREYGGVVPEIASREHVTVMPAVIREAVQQAGIELGDLDAVAVGHRPGLIGSLLVGVSAAKTLAWSLGVPLIGVDHVHAHLHAATLEMDEPPAYPALGLVVSGGHTAMYHAADPVTLTRLGATIDDAVGEAYDKVAAMLGLEYPGGPEVDRLAQEQDADDRAVDLPISRLGRESLDYSFSGVKTAVLYAINGVPRARRGAHGKGGEQPPPLTAERKRDIAASFQRVAASAVMLKLERALIKVPEARSLIAGGGVTANSRLRDELLEFASRHGLALHVPPLKYCVDNAAMIAGLGAEQLARGERDGLDLVPVPTTAC